MPLSRRHLLLATAPLGLAAAVGVSAPALAAPAAGEDDTDGLWDQEFLTRPETRQGFLVDDLDAWQEQNARFVIAVVKGHDLGAATERAAQIALATAIVEAWLYNYEPAVDLDSGGMFQQRPSMGWGSAEEVRHKKRAIDAFLGLGDHSECPGLLDVVADVEHADIGAAAQAVQASAHPERYAEQAAAARELWDRFAGDVEPFTD